MRRILAMALIAVMGLSVIGFAQPGSSPDEPIYMLLVPSTEGATVEATGKIIAEAIYDITGLFIVSSLQADYTAMIEAFAASTGDTFGMPTTDQYIRIYERTEGNVSPRLGSVRYGYTWYYASVYARRDSGIKDLADLDGKIWIYSETGSTSGYVFPNMIFNSAGLVFSSIVTTGGHTNSMVALVEGQGDFCTGYGSAPAAPADWSGARWEFGDDPEMWIWDRWNDQLFRDEFFGTVYDLRRAVRKTYDYDQVLTDIGVVLNIGPIPNDCMAFGPDFPVAVADQIVDAVKAHIATDEGLAVWSDPLFYEWTAVADIDDSFYDGYREILGLPVPVR
ncbi:PhnD/SsuA/transferrin family substrate-binding protein [Candidatus Bipolaricaulota bacterium]|nr:PhnD/SsuA/transferrin family substrate-binding protein [Candidatus Bipolaricaulota bacterium]